MNSKRKSSREVGALPPTALSHHRAYRSVHGGFQTHQLIPFFSLYNVRKNMNPIDSNLLLDIAQCISVVFDRCQYPFRLYPMRLALSESNPNFIRFFILVLHFFHRFKNTILILLLNHWSSSIKNVFISAR